MTVPLHILRAMRDAGCSAAQIVAVIEADLDAVLIKAVADGLSADAPVQQVARAFEEGATLTRSRGIGDVTSVTAVTPVTPVTLRSGPGQPHVTRRNPLSAGALRTRRWRERQQIRAVQGVVAAQTHAVLRGVTRADPVTVVTPVTLAAGRTPLKGVQPLPGNAEAVGLAQSGGAGNSGRKPRRSRAERLRSEGQLEIRTFGQIAGGNAGAVGLGRSGGERAAAAAKPALPEDVPKSAEAKASVKALLDQFLERNRRGVG